MFSSRTSKPTKTYSRQKSASTNREEPPTKRRRVESPSENRIGGFIAENTCNAVSKASGQSVSRSSSPVPEPVPIFSDAVSRSSTPPSSPPAPRLSPVLQTQRPVLSLLKRKHPASGRKAASLTERSDNAPKPFLLAKKPRLTQLQIDLGGEIRKTCKQCGMEYIPSNTEDAALHKKFHAMNVGGVDLTKAFVESIAKSRIWSGERGSFVVAITRKDSLAAKNKAKKVLEVVNSELSAVPIGDKQLWGQVSVMDYQAEPLQNGTRAEKPGSKCNRYKVYLYIQGCKCIGLCLAERISGAYKILDREDVKQGRSPSKPLRKGSSISTSLEADPAVLGISRIWTSSAHRKKGIARRLLDCVVGDFLYGLKVPPEMVAFSQPTESGGELARRWFGKESGWHVYTD